MGKTVRLIAYGVLIWLIPFAIAFALFKFRADWRSLFESVMAVSVAAVTALFGFDYLRRGPAAGLGTGLAIGFVWMAISIVIDLPLILSPPISMPAVEYAADIALTYLMMPVITAALAAAFAASSRKGQGS